jgi:hypothetical protein
MLPGRCPVGLPGVLLGAAGLLPGCRVGRRTDPHIGGLACQAAGLPARLPGTVAARLLPGRSECPGLPGPGPSEHTRHPPAACVTCVPPAMPPAQRERAPDRGPRRCP